MPAWFLIAWQVVQAVYYVFKYGPEIVNMVQEILGLLRKLKAPDTEKEVIAKEFKAAVGHYRTTKDKAPLRKLRERLHQRCFGN
jgi:predicted choloylglycine hydrolase